MSVIRYNFKTNEEWRKERANSIGASAISIIMGENHFITPMELAVRMREELARKFDYTQNLSMMRGHAYEQGVADLFNYATGLKIIKSSSTEYLLRRSDIPYMHASPDRTYWIDENGTRYGKNAELNKGILECKTSWRRRAIDPENPPIEWVFQLQMQMGISGYKEGYLAWDVIPQADGFGFKRYEYDAEVFEVIKELCRDFWERCVIGGEDPDPVSKSDHLAKYPESTAGKTKVATDKVVKTIEEIKELDQAMSSLKEQIELKRKELILEFTDEDAIVDNNGNQLVTYRTRKGSVRVDSEKLQSIYPDVYKDVCRYTADTRILNIK